MMQANHTDKQRPILPDVLQTHVEEAAFQWQQWERALASPLYRPKDVEEGPEALLLAHLEALREGGKAAVEGVLRPALGDDDSAMVFVSAWALLGIREPNCDIEVLDRLKRSEPDYAQAIRRAIELSGRNELEKPLLELLENGEEPAHQACALDVAAFHQWNWSAQLPSFLTSKHSEVACAAIRAARFAAPSVVRAGVEQGLLSQNPKIRNVAIETGMAFNWKPAWLACRKLVESNAVEPAVALFMLAVAGGEAECEMLIRALDREQSRADALWALGFTGRRKAADACVPWMRQPEVAKLAAEAFSAITGLVVEGDLELGDAAQEPDSLPPLEEEDLDAELVPGPESELPTPDAARVESWWKSNRQNFNEGTRYLSGKPFTADVFCEELLALASMRRRRWMALELAIRCRDTRGLQLGAWLKSGDASAHKWVRELNVGSVAALLS